MVQKEEIEPQTSAVASLASVVGSIQPATSTTTISASTKPLQSPALVSAPPALQRKQEGEEDEVVASEFSASANVAALLKSNHGKFK